MVQNHLKRIATPKTWSILRKEHVFITRPNPGAHPYRRATSLNTLFKEQIGLASTTKEVKRMLKEQEVLIDGKRRHDERYNVGFMDVISFKGSKDAYRIIFSEKGKIIPIKIKADEANLKIGKIRAKKTLKGGKTQIELNNGRNIRVDKDTYAVGDSLLITLPDQTIKTHLELKVGASVVVYKGKYTGQHGVVEKIEGSMVYLKTASDTIHTKKQYAYVTGDKKPAITCAQ